MALAHVCPVCGEQLSRRRAVLDAAYSLPIVVCDCGFACVRRKHPLLVRWRRAKAAANAIATMMLHLLLLAMLTFFVVGLCYSLRRDLSQLGLTVPKAMVAPFGLGGSPSDRRAFSVWLAEDGGAIALAALSIVSLIAGAWLRSALAHWQWPRPVLAWAGWLVLWMFINVWMWPLTWLWHVGDLQRPRLPTRTPKEVVDYCSLGAISFGMSMVGVPVGRMLSHGARGLRKRRWMKLLRKLRKRRRGE